MTTRIRTALLTGSLIWCLSAPVAALFSVHGVYDFFSLICHQKADRSWFLWGRQLPICIRCASIYAGFLFGLGAKLNPHVGRLRLAFVFTLAHVVFEWTVSDFVFARIATGLFLGSTSAPFVLTGLEQIWEERRAV